MSIQLKKIFGTNRPLIGMIHFPPLVDYPGHPGMEYIENKAVKETKILEAGGVDAIMVENNYDTPHHEFVTPETTSMMIALTELVCQNTHLPVGVSTLWNDYKTSLQICASTRASFFRAPAFVDSVKTSYGTMIARSKEINDYRKKLNLEHIAILADVQVKHSEMIEKGKPLSASITQAIEANADAIIITGKWTGDSPRPADLQDARKSAGDFPILIGSGATKDNLNTLLKYADGIIVGTAIKEGESTDKTKEINLKPYEYSIDLERTKEFTTTYKKLI